MSKLHPVYSIGRLALACLLTIVVLSLPTMGRTQQPTLRHLYTVDRYSGNSRFLTPIAIFLDTKRQELYLCDSAASKLITFDAGGNPLGYFYHRQKGQLGNSEPAGVAVNDKGTVFVSDATVGRVYMYDYRGEPMGFLPMPEGCMPGKMAVDGAENLYVAVRSAGKIVVFDPTGKLKREITGPEHGGMGPCCDVAVDANGTIYALSTKGTTVHIFDEQGKQVRAFGSHEAGKTGFARPSGIDVDGKGRVWVTDMVNQTLKVFSPKGQFLEIFGGFGSGPGDFFSPADVCVDRIKGRLFVVEKSGQRLQAFAIEER
ncbi:MAG: 6-bladed beta-propeller [Armatimonadetes bacterium]|nr:6-bladed beta-propeller [Armatimonadota bacterium]